MILAIIGAMLVVTSALILIFNVQAGVLLAIAVKPIIDASWSYSFGGINAPKIMSGLVPILVLLHARGKGRNLSEMPLFGLWMTYLVFNMLSSLSTLFYKDLHLYLDQSLRILNSFVGFYMIQAYVHDRESLRKLLKIFLFASIFPLTVAMFQTVTGVIIQERISAGFTRLVGFYHDAIVLRYYCFQTIIAVLLYWGYFVDKKTKAIEKAVIIGFFVVSIIALFNLYTKAGYMIIALWAIIWTISRKQFIQMFGIVLVILLINIIFYDKIWDVAGQVYWKEISAIKGEEDIRISEETVQKRSFSGRWYIWERALDVYWNLSAFGQLVGRGYGFAAHNDYLYRLTANGIIGLILYVTLLIAIGSRVYKNYLRSKEPIYVVALMLFAMWMVDSTGLVPSAYTGYQWYVWGIIALSLKGINFYDNSIQHEIEDSVDMPESTNRVILAKDRKSMLLNKK